MNNLTVGMLVRRFPNIVQPYILNQIVAMESADINILLIAGNIGTNITQPCASKNTPLTTNPIYINTSLINALKFFFSPTKINRKYISAVCTILQRHHWKRDGIKELFRKITFARILSYQGLNVIHSHSLFSSSDYLFLQQDFSIPLITTYHGVLPPGVAKLKNNKLLKVFDEGTLFLVNTQSAKNDLANLGCPTKKIQIIPQGTNMENFPYQEHVLDKMNKISLLSVGRLSPEKGHRTAIKAIAKLIEDFPTIEYHIVGDGPERAALQELILEHGLTGKVILHGFKSLDELVPFYSKSDMLIVPSIEETQGTVLQEAQASGLPVIASRAGGIPDVIKEGQTGLLFKVEDSNDLAEKIKRLITSPELYSNLAVAGRKDAEKRFDIKIICKDLLSIYNKLASKKTS